MPGNDLDNGRSAVLPDSVRVPGTEGYAVHAATLIPLYEAVAFEERHRAVLHLLPAMPGRVLDIGAGTGIDAAWFAARGHRVVAVEPTAEFRAAAMERHASAAIEWLDDALPELERVLARGQTFDTILLSAVWMHLNESERRIGMPALASLLAPEGVMLLSLRHGPVPEGRRMFQVSAEETVELARQEGLRPVLNVQTEAVQAFNRAAGVSWTSLAFRRAM